MSLFRLDVLDFGLLTTRHGAVPFLLCIYFFRLSWRHSWSSRWTRRSSRGTPTNSKRRAGTGTAWLPQLPQSQTAFSSSPLIGPATLKVGLAFCAEWTSGLKLAPLALSPPPFPLSPHFTPQLRGRLKEERRLLAILEEQSTGDRNANEYLMEAGARCYGAPSRCDEGAWLTQPWKGGCAARMVSEACCPAPFCLIARLRVSHLAPAALEEQVAELERDPRQREALAQASQRKAALRAVRRRIGRVEREMGDREPRSWSSFQAAMRVMQRAGALTADAQPVLTPLGEAVSAIRAVNELWQALVLLSQELDSLEPAPLAGVVAALLAPECVNRPSGYSSAQASEDALDALKRLAPLADSVLDIQEEEGFEVRDPHPRSGDGSETRSRSGFGQHEPRVAAGIGSPRCVNMSVYWERLIFSLSPVALYRRCRSSPTQGGPGWWSFGLTAAPGE